MSCVPWAATVAELRVTWGQLGRIAEAMGLRDDDPEPTAAMICGWLEAAQVVNEAARRLDGDGDDGDGG